MSIIFGGVSLSKDISFSAFDGLPGVTISNFNLVSFARYDHAEHDPELDFSQPSDDPAGGITISTDSLIPSLSNLGVDLG